MVLLPLLAGGEAPGQLKPVSLPAKAQKWGKIN